MLLVNYDETETLDGSEKGGTRTDYDVGIAVTDRRPLIIALSWRELAVLDGDAAGEPSCHAPDRLRCERDLRHQHDCLLAQSECVLDGPQVGFGLATAGDAVQEKCLGAALFERFDHWLQGLRLLLGQRRCRQCFHCQACERITIETSLFHGCHAQHNQLLNLGPGTLG